MVDEGDAVTAFPVVVFKPVAGLQVNVVPGPDPVATRLTDLPAQMVAAEGAIFTVQGCARTIDRPKINKTNTPNRMKQIKKVVIDDFLKNTDVII